MPWEPEGDSGKIIDKEADYILQVKRNQENLIADIAVYFEKDVFPCKKKDLAKERRSYKDVCFDHGKQETREYYVENEIGWLKANHPERKGLAGWEQRNMESAKGCNGEWRTACTGCWT